MSNLKNVRAELEKMKKEMAAKEAELKREEARPVIELINSELLNSEAVQEKMSAYSKDEARVIAKHIVWHWTCQTPVKKYKLYKISINKSLHFAQKSLSSNPR